MRAARGSAAMTRTEPGRRPLEPSPSCPVALPPQQHIHRHHFVRRARRQAVGSRQIDNGEPPAVEFSLVSILSGFQIFLAVMVILLILLHSGKDAGLSGAFGVGAAGGPFGGGSLVERTLDRWTILFCVLFVVNVIVLLKID